MDSIVYSETIAKSTGKKYPKFTALIGTRGGKRIRLCAPTLEQCKAKVSAWYRQEKTTGHALSSLTTRQASDALLAFSVLEDAHITANLVGIVEDYIRRVKDTAIVKTKVQDAYDAYVAHFTEHQTESVRNSRSRVGPFVVEYMNDYVDAISQKAVLAYLDRYNDKSPTTWNNVMTELRTFFNWCGKKVNRFCVENPLEGVEKKKVKASPNECAKPSEVRKLFAYAMNMKNAYRDTILFRITLNYFGGVRVAEANRVPVEDVRIEDGSILVRDAKGTQSGKMSYRTFRIDDCGKALSAWLKVINFKNVKAHNLCASTFESIMTDIKKKSGAALPDNAGRHSFVSYHVSAFGNPQKTEGIVGTSAGMRKHHYQTLMTKKDGEEYFSITPSSI